MSNRLFSALRQIGPRIILRGAILIAVLVAAGVFFNRVEFEQMLGWFNFSADADAGLLHGPAAYFVLAAVFTGAGGPRQVISFFAAYFFGLAGGFVLALIATLAGCALAVAAASGFREPARRFIRGKLDVAIQLWAKNAFGFTLILRLLPFTSNLVTNLAAGATGVPKLRFFSATAVGYIPQTAVFALMGSGVNIQSGTQVTLSIVLFGASVLLGVWIYAHYRKELKRNGAQGGAAPAGDPGGA